MPPQAISTFDLKLKESSLSQTLIVTGSHGGISIQKIVAKAKKGKNQELEYISNKVKRIAKSNATLGKPLA